MAADQEAESVIPAAIMASKLKPSCARCRILILAEGLPGSWVGLRYARDHLIISSSACDGN
jgi:hypothetical protein